MQFTSHVFLCGKCNHSERPKQGELYAIVSNGEVVIRKSISVHVKGFTPHVLFWNGDRDYNDRFKVHCYCGVCGISILPFDGNEIEYSTKIIEANVLFFTEKELNKLIEEWQNTGYKLF